MANEELKSALKRSLTEANRVNSDISKSVKAMETSFVKAMQAATKAFEAGARAQSSSSRGSSSGGSSGGGGSSKYEEGRNDRYYLSNNARKKNKANNKGSEQNRTSDVAEADKSGADGEKSVLLNNEEKWAGWRTGTDNERAYNRREKEAHKERIEKVREARKIGAIESLLEVTDSYEEKKNIYTEFLRQEDEDEEARQKQTEKEEKEKRRKVWHKLFGIDPAEDEEQKKKNRGLIISSVAGGTGVTAMAGAGTLIAAARGGGATVAITALTAGLIKVTSKFGTLGKVLGGIIGALGAFGLIVAHFGGRSNQNVLRASVHRVNPTFGGAMASLGKAFLDDESALIGDVKNLNNMKANLSTHIGFTQELQRVTSSPLIEVFAKYGLNPVQFLQGINGKTPEQAYKYIVNYSKGLDDNSRRLLFNHLGFQGTDDFIAQAQQLNKKPAEYLLEQIEKNKATVGFTHRANIEGLATRYENEANLYSQYSNNPKAQGVLNWVLGGIFNLATKAGGDNDEKFKKIAKKIANKEKLSSSEADTYREEYGNILPFVPGGLQTLGEYVTDEDTGNSFFGMLEFKNKKEYKKLLNAYDNAGTPQEQSKTLADMINFVNGTPTIRTMQDHPTNYNVSSTTNINITDRTKNGLEVEQVGKTTTTVTNNSTGGK